MSASIADVIDLYNLANKRRTLPGIDFSKPPQPPPPGKYPFVGNHYWGESPGYVYNPYDDTYYPDRKSFSNYEYGSGILKKPPSAFEQALPALGLLGAKEAIGSLFNGSALSAGKSLLGLGKSALGGSSANLGGVDSVLGGSDGFNVDQPFTFDPTAADSVIDGSGGGFGGGAGGEAGDSLLSSSDALAADSPTLLGSETAGAFLPVLGAAAGAYVGSKQFGGAKDLIQGKPLDWQEKGALVPLTGGLSLLSGLLDHETTRQRAEKDTQSLLGQSPDAAWQTYVNGMRGQYNSAPPDPSHPFDGGKYATWDDYQKGGLDAKDLTGVYGNLNTFGPDWAKLNHDQQQKVTQALIDNNLYTSNKGEVDISDPNKAKALYAQILQGKDPSDPTLDLNSPDSVAVPLVSPDASTGSLSLLGSSTA